MWPVQRWEDGTHDPHNFEKEIFRNKKKFEKKLRKKIINKLNTATLDFPYSTRTRGGTGRKIGLSLPREEFPPSYF